MQSEQKVNVYFFKYLFYDLLKDHESIEEVYNTGLKLGERIADDFFYKTNTNKLTMNLSHDEVISMFFKIYLDYQPTKKDDENFIYVHFADFYLSETDSSKTLKLFEGILTIILKYYFKEDVKIDFLEDLCVWKLKKPVSTLN